jgi:hypothetical protein
MPKAIAAEGDTVSLDTPQTAPIPFQALADGLEQMRSGGREAVGLGQHAGNGTQRDAPLLGPPTLGDVFACNQDDRIIASPPHGLGIFTNPEHAAILADLADFPAMRTTEVFYAGCHMAFNELSIFLEKDIQHRLSN